jgi:hypothetical protein
MASRKFVPNNRLGDVKPLAPVTRPVARVQATNNQQGERRKVKSHWEGTASATGEFSHATGNSTASGDYSAALNYQNIASGTASFAAGSGATAANNNTFVWSDGTTVTSTAVQQFIVRATGGISLTTGSAQTTVSNGATGVAVKTSTQTIGSNTTWSYVPGVPANWSTYAYVPTNVADALDELALAVAGDKFSCLYSSTTNSSLCITDASLIAIINLNTELTLFANGGLQVGLGSATGANSFSTGNGSASGSRSMAGGFDSVAFDSGAFARGIAKFTNAGDAQFTKHVLKQSQTGAGTFNIEDVTNGYFATIPPSTAFIATIHLIGVDTTSFDNYGLYQTVRGYNTAANVLTVNNVIANVTGQGTLASKTVAVTYASSAITSGRSRFTITVVTSSGTLSTHVTRWVANIEITYAGAV